MAARILNFLLRYGFLNEKKSEGSGIYTQAQKMYESFSAINLSSNLFAKKGSEDQGQSEEKLETIEFDKFNSDAPLKNEDKLEENKQQENGESAQAQ